MDIVYIVLRSEQDHDSWRLDGRIKRFRYRYVLVDMARQRRGRPTFRIIVQKRQRVYLAILFYICLLFISQFGVHF